VSSEESLVRRAIEGDQLAFTQLYDEHFDKIYRYIYFRVGNQAEAEDLTQEVFFKALGAIGSYKWRSTPFAAWLFRIAHNQVIDYFRRQMRQKTVTLDEEIAVNGIDPVDVAERELEIQEVTEALAQISEAQRETFSLRFVAGLSIAEVAKTLGKSEGAVKALQHNATMAIRKIILEKGNG